MSSFESFIDFTTLNDYDITYEEIASTNADVLMISDAWRETQSYGEFITEEINLSPEEAQQFWPVYNKYNDRIHKARLELERGIQRDQAMVPVTT